MGDIYDAFQEAGYYEPRILSYDRLPDAAEVVWDGRTWWISRIAPDRTGYWLSSSRDRGGVLEWADREPLEEANLARLTTHEHRLAHAPTAYSADYSMMRNFRIRLASELSPAEPAQPEKLEGPEAAGFDWGAEMRKRLS